MAAPHLSISWLQVVDRALRQDAMMGRFNLDFLLKSLKDIGFKKLRYFEHSENDLAGKSYYVLRGVSDDVDLALLPTTILPSDEINQYVPINQLKPKPFLGCDLESSPELCNFQDAIGSRGFPSVFIPIHAGDELSGKLCASWPGRIDELSEQDLDALVVLSRLCGRYAKLAVDTKLSVLYEKVSSISFKDEESGFYDSHAQFLEILNDACEAKILAIFESNWADSKIKKICERRFQDPKIDHFEEHYHFGEHLSGFAFSHSEPLLITSVADLQSTDHPRISKKSIARHTELIGPFESILFAPFESGHRDFFARLISRGNAVCENFSNIDLYAVERLCKRYGHHSNEFANEKNLENINRLFQISISDFSKYTNVIDEFSKNYSRVFGGEIVLLARENEGASLDHIYSTSSNPIFSLSSVDADSFSRLLKKIERDVVSILRSDEFEDLSGTKLRLDESVRCTHVFVINFGDADVEGVLISPIESTNSAQAIRSAIKPKTIETLKIIAAIVASSISASANHITTENAKRLIGHIGHEIESPIADLIDVCRFELRKTRKKIVNMASNSDWLDELVSEIDQADKGIDERSKAIAILMSVAVDMAQETENRLDVTYDKLSLHELLVESSEIVKKEAPTRLQPIGIKVNFEFNQKLSSLPMYVGDYILLQKAFVNIFRNAVKYSYPPAMNSPITVKVRAIEQINFVDFEIENWGVPITSVEFEKIFRPFERGSARDPVRARRGMGLGLYITRRFVEAHEGTVKCMSSKPTLDDPQRRFREGHLTTFAVRLPKGHALTVRGGISR